jgi:hypothetical protein
MRGLLHFNGRSGLIDIPAPLVPRCLTSGSIVFSNSNGVGFGLNAGTLTASYTVPTQSNQSVGMYALGTRLRTRPRRWTRAR